MEAGPWPYPGFEEVAQNRSAEAKLTALEGLCGPVLNAREGIGAARRQGGQKAGQSGPTIFANRFWLFLFSDHSTKESATPNATPKYKWVSFNELTH